MSTSTCWDRNEAHAGYESATAGSRQVRRGNRREAKEPRHKGKQSSMLKRAASRKNCESASECGMFGAYLSQIPGRQPG